MFHFGPQIVLLRLLPQSKHVWSKDGLWYYGMCVRNSSLVRKGFNGQQLFDKPCLLLHSRHNNSCSFARRPPAKKRRINIRKTEHHSFRSGAVVHDYTTDGWMGPAEAVDSVVVGTRKQCHQSPLFSPTSEGAIP